MAGWVGGWRAGWVGGGLGGWQLVNVAGSQQTFNKTVCFSVNY